MFTRWEETEYQRRRPDVKEKPFLMPSDGNSPGREFPGLSKKQRMRVTGDAYSGRDPDLVCWSPPAPPHLQKAFDDVFAYCKNFPDGTVRLKLRQHAHTKEWAIYQCTNIVENSWQCWYRAREWTPSEGHIPKDLAIDKFTVGLSKVLGDFYEPARDMFEMVEKANVQKYGVDTVNAFVGKPQEDHIANAEKSFTAFEEDWLSYNFNAECDQANQNAGSGQHMRSIPWDAEVARWHESLDRWVIEKVPTANGFYNRRRKRSAVEYRNAILEKLADKLLALEAKQQAEREETGLQKMRTPEELTARRLIIQEELAALAEQKIIDIDDRSARLKQFDKNVATEERSKWLSFQQEQ